MNHIKAVFCILFCTAIADGATSELLENGDFEKGVPTADKPQTFNCRYWQRELFKEDARNSWLTNGELDWQVGKDNQALQYRWGATTVHQPFTALGGKKYDLSVDFLNPGTPANRWNPRIRVKWFGTDGKALGQSVTVVEAELDEHPVKEWVRIAGEAVAPTNTSYGRIMLDINRSNAGPYFQGMYFDNASVKGEPGNANLAPAFANSPYALDLGKTVESKPYTRLLREYAFDKDGDELVFSKKSGPEWIVVEPDGRMHGKPSFSDRGENSLQVEVADGDGKSSTATIIISVVGLLRPVNLFDSEMVLQREEPIPVWGKALPNRPVRVRLGDGEAVGTRSDADGNWSVLLPAQEATMDAPVAMTIASTERRMRLENILVGDVWICSGQSNMAWPLINTENGPAAIESAKHPLLRLLDSPETIAREPWSELKDRAEWQKSNPESAREFSAVGFYFGRKLVQDLGVPIGLISSNQGGTRIEKWAVNLLQPGAPTFYNSRIHPYTRMPIKGFIWYQGEANIADGAKYKQKMETLVSDWRKAWNGPELPFYFVQLAPYNYGGDDVYALPRIWAAQTGAMETIPNCGMVVINDIGNVENIHPRKKQAVGERLARLAEYGTYGRNDLEPCGPMADSVWRMDGSSIVKVEFSHIGGGLAARDGQPLEYFELAGADKRFHEASARIQDNTVMVGSPAVENPAWIRFAWHETAVPNLMNKVGLPANSFMMKIENNAVSSSSGRD